MAISNQEIATILRQAADLLEIYAENPYRIRAYRRAARSVDRLTSPISQLVAENVDLTTIPNIGKVISAQIHYILVSGKMPDIYKKPIKPRKRTKEGKEKFYRFKTAELMINHLQEHLKKIPGVLTIDIAGNFRRKAELVGNTDIIMTIEGDKKIIFEEISKIDLISEVTERQENFISFLLRSSLLVTTYVIPKSKKGIALIRATGSNAHVEALNLTDIKAKTEEEVYQSLGLSYIPPELRENRGEIAAAANNKLPKLVSVDDIRGDLHTHTNETDGTENLERMVQGAIAKGYEYMAITDHSKRLAITNGLDEKRLLKQIKQIDALNAKLKNFVILKAIEVDILEDGNLDLSNDVLKELDLCVCSIHSRFRIPEEKQTERILRAMDNPYFNILGHATGRLLVSRPPYQIDMPRIMQAAKDRGCFIELNGQPARLDIHDEYCIAAKQLGVKIAISSDAHSIPELNFMRFGVNQARRGWLEKEDVINTRSLANLRKLLKRN